MGNWIDVCPCGCGAARVENPWVEKQKGNVVSSTDASHSHHLLSPVNGEKRKELCFIQRQDRDKDKRKLLTFVTCCHALLDKKRRNAFFRYLCFASDIKIIYISMALIFINWCQGYHSVIITQITRYDAYIQISVAALVFFYYLSSV